MSSPETVKVVLLGEAGVGKLDIMSQLTSGTFDPDTISSLSAQFISKTIEFKDINKAIKFDIWDTSGQEKFRALSKIFYKDAKVICLVYDITSHKSFKALKEFWYEQQTKLNVDGDPIYAVLANKSDLYESQEVNEEEAKEFAKSINAIFQSISSKSNSNVRKLFDKIGHRYFDPNYNTEEIKSKEEIEYEKKKNEKDQKKEQILQRGVKLTKYLKKDQTKLQRSVKLMKYLKKDQTKLQRSFKLMKYLNL